MPFKRNQLLAGLVQADLALLLAHLSLTPLPLGKILCEAGGPVDRIFFPFSGVVSMLNILDDGSEVECCTMGNETAFGLIAAQEPNRSYTRDMIQIGGEGASMSSRAMQDAFASSSTLAAVVSRHIQVVSGFMAQSVACNARHRVEARLCRWLLTCADYVEGDYLPLKQDLIAAMLGVQRSSVSEAAAGLREQGIIRVARGKITIVDRAALLQRSCECYGVTRQRIDAIIGPPSRKRTVLDDAAPRTFPFRLKARGRAVVK